MVLCLSEQLGRRVASGVYPEILYAIAELRKQRPGASFLIPIRLSDCEIPSIEIDDVNTLEALHYIDLYPDERREEGLEKLLITISQIRESSASASP